GFVGLVVYRGVFGVSGGSGGDGGEGAGIGKLDVPSLALPEVVHLSAQILDIQLEVEDGAEDEFQLHRWRGRGLLLDGLPGEHGQEAAAPSIAYFRREILGPDRIAVGQDDHRLDQVTQLA